MTQELTFSPDVDRIVQILLDRVKTLLGDQFVAFYLEGSLAYGDFDQDSDIDFVVVTTADVSQELFLRLQKMHDQIAVFDSPWAVQLEGSYLSRSAVRGFDQAHASFPNIERGPGERLKWVAPDRSWDIHRSVTRDRGITLTGPDPRELIDPVSPAQLQHAMQWVLSDWGKSLLSNPEPMGQRGYQSYTVLTMCRILFTLRHAAITSKKTAADWGKDQLGANWSRLISSAWEGRHAPDTEATPEDIQGTLDFIRYTLVQAEISPEM
jgi:hypothetical protein